LGSKDLSEKKGLTSWPHPRNTLRMRSNCLPLGQRPSWRRWCDRGWQGRRMRRPWYDWCWPVRPIYGWIRCRGMLTVALCRLGSRTHDAALEHLWAELTVTETFSIALGRSLRVSIRPGPGCAVTDELRGAGFVRTTAPPYRAPRSSGHGGERSVRRLLRGTQRQRALVASSLRGR